MMCGCYSDVVVLVLWLNCVWYLLLVDILVCSILSVFWWGSLGCWVRYILFILLDFNCWMMVKLVNVEFFVSGMVVL